MRHIKNKKPLHFEADVKTHDGSKVKLMASIELGFTMNIKPHF